jgi:hypothetical protein
VILKNACLSFVPTEIWLYYTFGDETWRKKILD